LGLFLIIFPDPINNNRTIRIQRLDKRQKVILVKNKNQGNIYGLSLEVVGKIDGKAIMQKGKTCNIIYQKDTIEQKIKLSLGGDWYQDTCYLIYQPLTSKSGVLNINYKFFGTNNF